MGRVFAFGLYLRKNCRLDFAVKFLTRDYASHSTYIITILLKGKDMHPYPPWLHPGNQNVYTATLWLSSRFPSRICQWSSNGLQANLGDCWSDTYRPDVFPDARPTVSKHWWHLPRYVVSGMNFWDVLGQYNLEWAKRQPGQPINLLLSLFFYKKVIK